MGLCFNKKKDLRPGQSAKPLGLTERADAEWDRLTRELEDSDIQLTPAHRSTLTVLGLRAAVAKSDGEREGSLAEMLGAQPKARRPL